MDPLPHCYSLMIDSAQDYEDIFTDEIPPFELSSAEGFFLFKREFFLAPVPSVLWGVYALGSVERLETISDVIGYIDQIESS